MQDGELQAPLPAQAVEAWAAACARRTSAPTAVAVDEALGLVDGRARTRPALVAGVPCCGAGRHSRGRRASGGAAPGSPIRLAPGQFETVDTGDPLPGGRDTVIQHERIEMQRHEAVVTAAPAPGRHVRGVGEDVAAGELLFGARPPARPGRPGARSRRGPCRAAGARAHRRLRFSRQATSCGRRLRSCGPVSWRTPTRSCSRRRRRWPAFAPRVRRSCPTTQDVSKPPSARRPRAPIWCSCSPEPAPGATTMLPRCSAPAAGSSQAEWRCARVIRPCSRWWTARRSWAVPATRCRLPWRSTSSSFRCSIA